MGPAQLTCPTTDTDHSDQSVPVLFAPLFLEGLTAVVDGCHAVAVEVAQEHAVVAGGYSGHPRGGAVPWSPDGATGRLAAL